MERLIGRYEGHQRGPLVLVLGAIHGNEPAGVSAIFEVLRLLQREPAHNPDFVFNGRITGFIGNLSAYKLGKRYQKVDMNRIWDNAHIDAVMAQNAEELEDEDRELRQLLTIMQQEVETYQPSSLIILDLHTTSAGGGIFSIPLETDPESIRIASELHAPVVMGLLKGLGGTFMHYANHHNSVFREEDRMIHTVAFESGQHNDPLSVNRSVSAVVSLLRAVGCVKKEDVNSHHDEILLQYARNLPKVTRITHVHHIQPDEHFSMQPGYENFQSIVQGEHLADNDYGPVCAPSAGHILMPLYQPQGVDGYFIVEELTA